MGFCLLFEPAHEDRGDLCAGRGGLRLEAGRAVGIGDTVAQGDTVCLIEAMKTFNPVKAHTAGKVTKILVESGDPVEYGEPLIVIE